VARHRRGGGPLSAEPRKDRSVGVLACAPALMVSIERTPAGDVADVHLHPGGQGFWVARMAARLGAAVTLVGPFGGESGVALRALIEAEGIRVSAVPTRVSNRVWVSRGKEGEPASVAESPAAALTRHEVDGLFNAMLAAGLESRVAVLTGDPEGALAASRYTDLAQNLMSLGGTVVADLSGEQLLAAVDGGLHAVKVAHDELVQTGLAGDDSWRQLVRGAGALRERGAGAVVVSRAEEPLLADLGDRIVSAGGPAFRSVNDRGAGDSATGALAAALAAGREMTDALAWAVAAGALNVTRHGLGSGESAAIMALAEKIEISTAGE
jgi:1-phosphofructokinase